LTDENPNISAHNGRGAASGPVVSESGAPPSDAPIGGDAPSDDSSAEEKPVKEPKAVPDRSAAKGPSNIVETQAQTSEGNQIAQRALNDLLRLIESQGDEHAGRDQAGLKNEGNVRVAGHQVGNMNVVYAASRQQPYEATFEDLMASLPSKPSAQLIVEPEEVQPHLDNLLKDHLILIASHYGAFAMDAAYALIDALGIPEEGRKKRLDLEAKLANFLITEESFLPPDASARTVVQIDVLNDNACARFSELINNYNRMLSLKSKLHDKRVYLLCIVLPNYLTQCASSLGQCAQWSIPFLRPLLKLHFPDDYTRIEQQILSQREQKLWRGDDYEFCSQVRNLLESGRLLKQIQQPDKAPPCQTDSIFKNEDHIVTSMLYVAAYLQGLAPGEFNQVVQAMLEDRKVVVSVPEYRQTDEQGLELVYSKIEKSLVDIWRDNTDEFMWKYLCEQDSPKDSMKVIEFASYQLRDSLTEFLEAKKSFFLKSRFNQLHNLGFLFHESVRVGESLTRLSRKMFLEYPEEFNKGWLIEFVGKVKDGFGLGGEIMQFIAREAPGALSPVYSRISGLMAQLLEDQHTKDIPPACLSELMRLGHHDIVFHLVKRLRSAPGIDEFFWIMQLLERGDAETKLLAYGYLFNHIRKQGRGFLQDQGALAKWIPKDAPKNASAARPCSNSTRYLLHALLEACVDSVRKVALTTYGSSPTKYDFFSFEDKETAEKAIQRLACWLLHPEMENAFRLRRSDLGFGSELNSSHSLVAALIAEWCFILRGPYQPSSQIPSELSNLVEKQNGDGPISSLDSAGIADILLRRVAAAASKDQRQDMLDYWSFFRRCLMEAVRFGKAIGDEGELKRIPAESRDQLIWRQNRLWELIEELKRL
jgi:hypothetical protein